MVQARRVPDILRRAASFLGLRRSIVGLLGMVVLVGLGEHMAEQFLPLYLMSLGGGFISVGALNALDNLLGALYSFPGGYAADRLGTKRSLLLFNLVAMSGFLLVILIPSWIAVMGGAVLFLSWTAISLPATMGLVARVLPKDKRTMGVSMHSLVRRVPMALGPILGGALIAALGVEVGVRMAFVAALFFAGVSLVLQQVLIEPDPPRAVRMTLRAESRPWRLWREMCPELRQLLVADILVRFCEQIPYAFVVIWAVGTATAPGPVTALQFGVLRTVEMVTAILIYIPVAYFADRSHKKPFVIMTFAFFTAFPLVLFFSHSFGILVLAFVLRGLKEFGEPTRKALIMDLAPEDRKAGMFGLYYLVRDTIVSVAAFGGAFLWALRPEVNLFVAFGFGLLGTIWFAWRGRDLGRLHVVS
ncbi:MFS transporter [Candidatus Bipolaricaulota bacterium]|nr:MFS transporter [Candidatus Bipolaricaulota bacterium]